jgi:hypothetical protein
MVDATHLIMALKMDYTITVDWKAEKYWTYNQMGL